MELLPDVPNLIIHPLGVVRYSSPKRVNDEIRYIGKQFHFSRIQRTTLVHVNGDYWKSDLHTRLGMEPDEPGAIVLFETADAHGHDAHDGHDQHGPHEPHESPWVVTVPLILLAIPSVLIGFFTVGPMLFGTDWSGHVEQLPFFLGAIDVAAARDTVAMVKEAVWHGPTAFALHGFVAPAFWLAFAGFALATVMYWWKPELATRARRIFALPVRVLENKYGFDKLWIDGFAGGGVRLGRMSRAVDSNVIDGVAVNGSARLVDFVAGLTRRVQSGFLYHYAFAMILGLIVLLAVLIRTLS